MGHGDTSCDPLLHQTVEQPTLHYLTRSVRRRAAWFKSASRKRPTGSKFGRMAAAKRTSRQLVETQYCQLDTPLRRSYTPRRLEFPSGRFPVLKPSLAVFLIGASATFPSSRE